MPDTLPDVFFQTAKKYSDRGALSHKIDGAYVDITYGECVETITDFAFGLHSLGFQKDDKAAIVCENRPEWAFSDYAVMSLGGVTVPIYPTMSAKQIEYILNDSHCRAVIVSQPEHLEAINRIFNNLKDLKYIITLFEPETPAPIDTSTWQDVIEKGKSVRQNEPGIITERRKELDGTDLATIVYTSGTTGQPKGVMLTHSNFVEEVKYALEIIKLHENDLFLSFLPLCHIYERLAGYYLPLYTGSKIAYAENVQTVGDNMREVHPTVMISVPRLYEKMFNLVQDNVSKSSFVKKLIFKWCVRVGKSHAQKKKRGKLTWWIKKKYGIADKLVFKKLRMRTGGKIRFFVSGGAPLTKEIAEFFDSAGLTILEGYGLTETTALIAVNPTHDCRCGTVGIIPSGIEVKIAEDGEICSRGPHIMLGYYNKPEETKEVFDDDGWFHTGDIGFIDEDGYLSITDRKKNIIVTSGGKNIAPQPIENLMVTSRYIEQIMMFGDRRQFPAALIVPSFENLEGYLTANGIKTSSRKEMINHPKAKEMIEGELKRLSVDLSHYELIKKFILLEEEFTQENDDLTPTMKVKRNIVEQKFAKQIEQVYAE